MLSNKKLENSLVQCITDHKESIYRLAYSYVRNSEDALDIVQESIHKAFSSAASLKNPDAMKSWFYRIVVNTSLDFLRKQKRIQLMDEETLESYSQGMPDVYQNIDLEKALEELPVKYRSVVVLRYFEDLKIEEIAEVLDENINTVKTRLYQALRVLRVKLNDDSYVEV
ncbi:RNA polymerase subunit sigma-70 [Paenibacillus selenitireducens]|uniref:RNA polymerase subunit sigma-70 n=1 Tax=Paenibacillus selenitireducens TaxID=1324314 RepID=A0A1T2X677_9BACL|nr:sigma-70 family RNA polymerase sigma factor [Paenibacillus selenitireducens]OPA75387.1 RNA polymerase subunit sigma-70 [Paenibacillus selenitireducens]